MIYPFSKDAESQTDENGRCPSPQNDLKEIGGLKSTKFANFSIFTHILTRPSQKNGTSLPIKVMFLEINKNRGVF